MIPRRLRFSVCGVGGRWLGAGLAALALLLAVVAYAVTEKITKTVKHTQQEIEDLAKDHPGGVAMKHSKNIGKIDEAEDEKKPGWIRWTIRDKSTKRRASVYYEKDKDAAYIDAEALGEQQGAGQIKEISAKGSK